MRVQQSEPPKPASPDAQLVEAQQLAREWLEAHQWRRRRSTAQAVTCPHTAQVTALGRR